MLLIESLLTSRRSTSTDDPDRALLSIDPDDKNEPTRDRADCDEAVFLTTH
jgi:hypothetical protein